MTGQHATRRSFLRQVAGTSALLFSRRGLGLAEVTPATTRIGPPVGLGVIGLGVWGREILSTLARLPEARVVAVCDTYAPFHKKALEIAPAAAALADARALIDRPDVEAVVVATPSHLHRTIAVAALAAGKHVYCEAPLAATIDDARAIALAARGARTVFQGGLQGRANSLYRHVGQFVKSGVLGTPVMASVHWARKDSWRRVAPTPARARRSSRRLDDAFRMLDTAKRTGRKVQVGTQGCTDPKFHRAREIVRSGALGRVLWAQTSYCRQNPKGEWNYEIDPAATADSVDWKAWLGPAPKRPFSPERYFRWRKYWDYGTGVIGDLLPHRLAPTLMAMGVEEYPASVSCMGGNLAETDRGPGPDGKPYGEKRDVGDTHLVTVQFPSGVMLFVASSTSNERGVEDLIRGQKANLLMGGGKLVLEPERPFSDEIERKEEDFPESKEVHAQHVLNFFQGLRGTAPLHCPIEDGVRIQAIVSMAEKSYREGRMVRFDTAARKMIV